ncbi:MAG TPA: ATP-binding protein, partial [Candidatus Dormibacteraeota bacterium]|nr:ATP-binding protein [Candidatus Dormibacteraeota bacterium]
PAATPVAALVTAPNPAGTGPPDTCLHLVDVREVTGDMTERRNSVDTLERMNRELEQRTEQLVRTNAELEQLASVLSHDLNEPLRVVAGFARLLAEDCSDHLDDTGQAYLHHITLGVNRMRALIDDLIAYARVGADTTTGEPVDCGAVMRAVADALSLTLANTDAELSVGDLPVVGGPGGDLYQLFSNLVGNALKFVAAGVRPRVAVDSRAEDDRWHFTVTDNGIGIDPARRERVFRMFQRLHPADTYDGTGIGLAICQKVVERRGGRIWIEGAPQGGSVVHFTLPALREEG